METIPLTPLQQVALRRIAAGETWSAMAERGGYVRGSRRETTVLRRRLGLLPDAGGRCSTACTYATAVRLARALDLDPVDIGV